MADRLCVLKARKITILQDAGWSGAFVRFLKLHSLESRWERSRNSHREKKRLHLSELVRGGIQKISLVKHEVTSCLIILLTLF